MVPVKPVLSRFKSVVPPPFRRRVHQKVEGAVKEGSFWVNLASCISSIYTHSKSAIEGVAVHATSEIIYLGGFTLVRLGGVLALPYYAVTFGKDFYNMVHSRYMDDKVDSGLRGISKIGTILKSIIVVSLGVRAVDLAGKGLKISLPLWGGCLIGVGMVLETGDAIASSVGFCRSLSFQRKLSRVEGTEETLRFLIEQDTHLLKRRFQVKNGSLLKERLSQELEKIFASKKEKHIQQKHAQAVLRRLKERVYVRMASDIIKTAAHIIGIVGLVILIFTPVAPLGYGLIAASVGLALTIACVDYAESKKPYRPEDDEKTVKKMRALWKRSQLRTKQLFSNGADMGCVESKKSSSVEEDEKIIGKIRALWERSWLRAKELLPNRA